MSDTQNKERFLGKELYTLDEKGRITIPKHWRLKGDTEVKWRLVPESTGNCLRLMEPWKFSEFVARAEEKLAADQAALRLFRSKFIGGVIEAEPDKQGRIAIPKETCESLGLSGEVWMRGAGDLIEIWNKQRFEEHERTLHARYQELAAIVGA